MSMLQDHLIRLHVVGASNEEMDQQRKLKVKDAVATYLRDALQEAESAEEAYELLQNLLPQVETVALETLRREGSGETVEITLGKESFPVRMYDTFSLPSGIYQSLRIRIGDAAGRNWWCVVFPSLCLPESAEELQVTAAGAGFSEELNATITGESGYEIRFFFLDLLGQLQNLWFGGN